MLCNCIELSRKVPYGTTAEREKILLDELKRIGILDSSPEDINFDRLTNLAARYFKMPVVLVSIADVSRLWLKSRVGLPITEIKRDFAFCNYTIRPDAPPVFIVLDADKDPRFCDKPFVVGPPYAKFYAGAPVICDGVKLGSFCVLDGRSHDDFDEEAQSALLQFASLASDLISQHKAATFDAKYDPSLLCFSILQVLHEPLHNAIHWHRELESVVKSVRNVELVDPEHYGNIVEKFNVFHGASNVLQQSLEVSLRFASSVAHHVPQNLAKKRKMKCEYSVKSFLDEIKRISGIKGYNETAWKSNVESLSNLFVHQDPALVAAIAGFLSLKHMNSYSAQSCFVNFIPEADMAVGSSSSVESGATDNCDGSYSIGGLIQVHCRFSRMVESEESKMNNFGEYAQNSTLTPYEVQLIREILFSVNGTFELLHFESDSVNREFRMNIRTTYVYKSPSPNVSWDGNALSASTTIPAFRSTVENDSDSTMMVVTSMSDTECFSSSPVPPSVSTSELGGDGNVSDSSILPPAKRLATDQQNSTSEKLVSPRMGSAMDVLISIVRSRPGSAKVFP